MSEIDRLVASRAILREGKTVEYKTEAEAQAAKEGIISDYPEWRELLVTENGTKFYVRRGDLEPVTAGAATEATPVREAGESRRSWRQRFNDWREARRARRVAAAAGGATAAASEAARPATATPAASETARPASGEATPAASEAARPATGEATPAASEAARPATGEATPAAGEAARPASETATPAAGEAARPATETATPAAVETTSGGRRGGGRSTESVHTVPGKNIPAHDADIVANGISGNRDANGRNGHNVGTPTEARIGSETVNIENIKVGGRSVKDIYEEALQNPSTKETELPKLDRLVASRSILSKESAVEYKTPEEAAKAKDAIEKDYPEWGTLVIETSGERTYLRRPETHDADFIAKSISDNRYQNGVEGRNQGTPTHAVIGEGNAVPIEGIQIKGRPIKELYEEAIRNLEGDAKTKELARLDRYVASRAILEQGFTVKYSRSKKGPDGKKLNKAEDIREAKRTVEEEHPEWGELVIETTSTEFKLRRRATPATTPEVATA